MGRSGKSGWPMPTGRSSWSVPAARRKAACLARPRGRLRAAPAPAHPDRVHRQPLARAADAAHDGRPAGRDAHPRGGRGRRRLPPRCAIGSPRSRWRRAISSRWSASCSTCRGSRAAAAGATRRRGSGPARDRVGRAASARSPSARASACEVARQAPIATGPRRRRTARPGPHQPGPQRGEVQPGRRRGHRRRCARSTRTSRRSSVTDHGVGIPRAAQARIFERFYKVDRARSAASGRHGPGPRDRPPRRRAARRPDLGRVERGGRLDVLVRIPPARPDEPTRGDRWTDLHVATLNIRNLADRWPERLPLLLADMAALQPDLLGLQEVVFAMQQDRLIGAAGEGRYDRSAAGRAGPSTATACSSASPWPRPTVGAPGAGPGPRGASGDRGAAGRRDRADRRDPPASRRRRRGRSATSRPGARSPGLTRRPAADATVVVGRLQRGAGRPAAIRMRARRLPVRVCRGERRRTGGHLAVRYPGAGDGHGRRPGVPRLHLGQRRVTGRRQPARLRPAGSDDPRSTRGTTSGSRPTSRSGRRARWPGRTLRLAHRGDWRVAPENSLEAMRAALAIADCDGLEFDVRTSVRRDPGGPPRRDAGAGAGPARPVDAMTAERSPQLGGSRPSPTCSSRPIAEPFLDVELKRCRGRGIVEILAAGRARS